MDMFLEYFKVFLIGGIICTIGQILIDKTKLTPAKILVVFVSLGVIFTALGLYGPLVEFGKSGATVPISGFGYSLCTGGFEEVDKLGFIGIFTGSVKATSAGITMAVFFGYVFALFSKSDIKG